MRSSAAVAKGGGCMWR